MRFDMVNVCRQPDDSVLLALNAKRMRLEDSSTKALPLVAITTSGRASSSLRPVRFSLSFHLSVTSVALFKVQVTVLLSKRNWLSTAWVLADR